MERNQLQRARHYCLRKRFKGTQKPQTAKPARKSLAVLGTDHAGKTVWRGMHEIVFNNAQNPPQNSP